jgi:hypothetical protein
MSLLNASLRPASAAGPLERALSAISSLKGSGLRALTLLVGALACSTALQAAPVSLNLGQVGDPATLWEASANINANQLAPNSAVLAFNCSACGGTLSQNFTLATASLFSLDFNFGFGEGACACDDPLRLRAWVDATEVFSALINTVIFSNPLNTPLDSVSPGAVRLSAGVHTIAFEIERLSAPGFIRAPYFVLGGVHLNAQSADPAPGNGVPEPSAISLMLAGLGLLGVVSRRRRSSRKPSAITLSL